MTGTSRAARWLLLSLPSLLIACGSSSAPTAREDFSARPLADAAAPDFIRTIPDPLCAADYLGTSGQLAALPDLGVPDAIEGGSVVTPEIAAALPDAVHLRDTQQSYNATHQYAVHAGKLYVKANHALTGIDQPWRSVLLPACLDGQLREISVDGTVILALNDARWIYTLDTHNYGPLQTGWTRRWGAPFWTDFGEQIPGDVAHWAASHWSGADKRYIDRAGREQKIAGILTVYLLRGDGLRITYMDPWLPSDESREVCGPERGTVALAGLSGSGSTVMVIARDGEVYTRLYEFDVSGANTMFLDYAWQDQDAAAAPLMQLPAPDWIHHSRIPGRVTERVSLRQLGSDTRHRQMRVEGLDENGNSGYWQKDLSGSDWRFVRTDEPLRGTLLPWSGPTRYAPEDSRYSGSIEGLPAEVPDFNPYCSPSTLRLHFASGPVEFILHSTDGLRQERRARGLDAQPHVYRSAIEVPQSLWNAREQQADDVREFIAAHFGTRRLLSGPLAATPSTLQFGPSCWNLQRAGGADAVMLPALPPDAGLFVAELRAAEEEGRALSFCGLL